MACYNDDLTTASVLLRAGAYRNGCNKFGQTPLLLAVTKNNVAMVKEVIGAGVDVNKMEQHPDTSLIKETVDEVVKRFHAQMDHVPLLSLYDSDKDVALKVPTTLY
ncbi:hypothetical protein GBAR_LOCUS11348 [Geodia barretti]|uniref:Uncharacterized protein n=1 Tax=Geodia barretti TaxID=519541 RepID=A0AA35RWX6_GEOBA|nr:hypothetical protein GBAR_LOCUS11348 [Geodia barretti]